MSPGSPPILHLVRVTFECMLQELNEKRVTLMEGTALSERDLQRSRAESASAVFLLADRFSPNYQQEDLNVQFQVQHTRCMLHIKIEACSEQIALAGQDLLHTDLAHELESVIVTVSIIIEREACLYALVQSGRYRISMLLNGLCSPLLTKRTC